MTFVKKPWLGIAVLVLNRPAWAQKVRCGERFPLKTFPPALRAKAENLLLRALDTEALYTIIGGFKPMSSGFASFKFPVANPKLNDVAEMRRILATGRCGDLLYADMHHFAKTCVDPKTKEELRFAEAVVFHRPAVAAAKRRQVAFFAPHALTPKAHPLETLPAIDYSAPCPRWRGQGYLIGFPDQVVDFFVNAGEEQKRPAGSSNAISIPGRCSPLPNVASCSPVIRNAKRTAPSNNKRNKYRWITNSGAKLANSQLRAPQSSRTWMDWSCR